MLIGKLSDLNRRAFLKRSGQLAVAGAASSYALDLAGINEAAAFNSDGSYKALVCVFLYGGNDHSNTLIPYDAVNYNRYASIRQGVALPRTSLANTILNQPQDQILTDDIQFALAPSMPRMKARFDQQKLAMLLNVGPLEAPLTRRQYESGNTKAYPRPSKLFSHNDQQAAWQSSGTEGSATGWGGRMGDLAQSSNSNRMFTTINATGNAVFLSGSQSLPFKVSKDGAVEMRPIASNRAFGSPDISAALREIMVTHHNHVFEQDYSNVVARSLEYAPVFRDALDGSDAVPPPVAENPLAAQLNIVARLISARARLGVSRQVFMVSLGAFDHHNNLIGPHELLLSQLDEALDQFYRTTVSMGVSENVTTFTASDFGRTLSVNGNGSDHGWGGHHFVLGGGVNGGRFYGTAPSISVTTDDQVGRGRLLPSTSVDEYSSTLALWFGVPRSELAYVAPHIGRFARSDLGFMKPL